jgi:hypothetical protein
MDSYGIGTTAKAPETPLMERFVLDLEMALATMEAQTHRLEAIANKLFGEQPKPTDPSRTNGAPESSARLDHLRNRIGSLNRLAADLSQQVDRLQVLV